MQDILYFFAYDEFVNPKRLEMIVGKPKERGSYRLRGYELVFNCGSDETAYAYISELGDMRSWVDGALYNLTDGQIMLLDSELGWPGNYEKIYFHESNKLFYTYISTNPAWITDAKPTMLYINTMLAGYNYYNLQESYKNLRNYMKNTVIKSILANRGTEDLIF